MANWKRQIDIKAPWVQAKEQQITLQELARIIADKLRSLPKLSPGSAVHNEDDGYFNMQQDDLADAFTDMAEDADLNADVFDSCMAELYDWGNQHLKDNGRVCWISTVC